MHLSVLNHLLVILAKIKQLILDVHSSNNKHDCAPRVKEKLIPCFLSAASLVL